VRILIAFLAKRKVVGPTVRDICFHVLPLNCLSPLEGKLLGAKEKSIENSSRDLSDCGGFEAELSLAE
jgi:hypothetical protein